MSRATVTAPRWPLRRLRPALASYLLLVDAVVLVVVIATLRHPGGSERTWGVLALALALSIAFEEGLRRAARLQLRMSRDLKRDMTSVWAVGAAVALRPAFAVFLLVPLLSYIWFRQQRPAGEPLYRKIFNACTMIAGCLSAGAAATAVRAALSGLPWMLGGLVAVMAAIVVYTAVNRALVTLALILMGAGPGALVGTREENLLEVATLCLGGLVALAMLYQPWLVVLVIAPMVTLQRGALVHELEVAATTDGKTGLLNAIAWEQVAQRELARARREGTSVGILIVDLDRFKGVNDRWGHMVGDAVLAGVGRAMAAAVREYDTVGRFGGEEFVAVLPDADTETAVVVAERLRARIAGLRVGDLAPRLAAAATDALSVSVGVAAVTGSVDADIADILHDADRALYLAKSSGRNRVCVAGRGDTPVPVLEG